MVPGDVSKGPWGIPVKKKFKLPGDQFIAHCFNCLKPLSITSFYLILNSVPLCTFAKFSCRISFIEVISIFTKHVTTVDCFPQSWGNFRLSWIEFIPTLVSSNNFQCLGAIFSTRSLWIVCSLRSLKCWQHVDFSRYLQQQLAPHQTTSNTRPGPAARAAAWTSPPRQTSLSFDHRSWSCCGTEKCVSVSGRAVVGTSRNFT